MQEITPATAVGHALAAAASLGTDFVFNELIYSLPTATLCEFMKEFKESLDRGDFDDMLEE